MFASRPAFLRDAIVKQGRSQQRAPALLCRAKVSEWSETQNEDAGIQLCFRLKHSGDCFSKNFR